MIKKEIAVDAASNLTVVSVAGLAATGDVLQLIESIYRGKPTAKFLLDFTKTDTSQLTGQDIKEFAERVKINTHSRIGGKTAVLVATNSDFGLGRMYESYVNVRTSGLQTRVFKSEEKARTWLNSKE